MSVELERMAVMVKPAMPRVRVCVELPEPGVLLPLRKWAMPGRARGGLDAPDCGLGGRLVASTYDGGPSW
jgi:hypothetical protein